MCRSSERRGRLDKVSETVCTYENSDDTDVTCKFVRKMLIVISCIIISSPIP